jgi:hypothetical protein
MSGSAWICCARGTGSACSSKPAWPTQQRFVIDNTNVLRSEREVCIKASKAARFAVVGYYFDVELEAALHRNIRRAKRGSIASTQFKSGPANEWKISEDLVTGIREGD